MKKIFIALLIFAQSSTGFTMESWQAIGGEKISFLLPLRAEKPNESLQGMMRSEGLINKKDSERGCPATSAVLYKIYENLVAKNNLQAFINEGPGMSLRVVCHESRASVFSEGPHANAYSVFMPAYVVSSLKFEDEIAAIMAHEISHILLEHNYQVRQVFKKLGINPLEINTGKVSRPEELVAVTAKTEGEADKLSMLLLMNAGYNPYFIKAALDNLMDDLFGKVLGFIGETIFDDGHGSNAERASKVYSYLQYAHLTEKPGILSPELEAAKIEIEGLAEKDR